MTQDKTPDPGEAPDASDVIEGPIGDAHLKDPATSGPIGADLDELEPIDDAPDADRGKPA